MQESIIDVDNPGKDESREGYGDCILSIDIGGSRGGDIQGSKYISNRRRSSSRFTWCHPSEVVLLDEDVQRWYMDLLDLKFESYKENSLSTNANTSRGVVRSAEMSTDYLKV